MIIVNQAKLIDNLLTPAYRCITGRTLDADSARISRVFTGFALKLAIAKALVMFTTLAIGRLLGTESYGSLSLILALGSFWCLPFFTCWAFAYVKYVSETGAQNGPQEYLSPALLCSFLALLCILPPLFIFREQLSQFFQIPSHIWSWSCIFGALMGFYYFSKSFFQAVQNWRKYVLSEMIFAFTLALGLILAVLFNLSDIFHSILCIFIISHLAGSILFISSLPSSVRMPTSRIFSKMFYYGTGLFVSFGISLFSMQLDRLLLNYFTTTHTLGRYHAYYMSTYGILSSFLIIINNYLLPLYGQYNKSSIQRIIRRLLFISAIPLYIFSIIAGRIVFYILGEAYSFSWEEMIWASLFAVIIFWLQVQVYFAMTLGNRLLLFNGLAYVAFMLVQLLTMPTLVRLHNVVGAFQGMTAASLTAFLIVYAAVTFFLRQGKVFENGL